MFDFFFTICNFRQLSVSEGSPDPLPLLLSHTLLKHDHVEPYVYVKYRYFFVWMYNITNQCQINVFQEGSHKGRLQGKGNRIYLLGFRLALEYTSSIFFFQCLQIRLKLHGDKSFSLCLHFDFEHSLCSSHKILFPNYSFNESSPLNLRNVIDIVRFYIFNPIFGYPSAYSKGLFDHLVFSCWRHRKEFWGGGGRGSGRLGSLKRHSGLILQIFKNSWLI